MSRTLFYAEVPCFYAAVERAADPGLTDRPVIVGGDPRKRGCVQAATEDALAQGVAVGMPVLDALERCPRARALRTRMAFYREASLRLRACLRRVVDALEPDGLDGAFLDATDRAEDPAALAESMAALVAAELRLSLRIGIAPVRTLAKLAAAEAGQAAFRRILPGGEGAFVGPLALARLPFIGPNAELRLARAGARTVGDALALDPARLEELLGNRALELLALTGGGGDARVRGEKQPRSLSQETTLDAAQRSESALREELGRLAAGLESALRVQGLGARKLALKLRYADQQTVTRSRTLVRALVNRPEIESTALELLARTEAGARPVRLIGLVLGRLGRSRRDVRQLDLFAPQR